MIILKIILKNIKLILVGIQLLLLVLWLQQCNKTKEIKAKLVETTQIANQNIAAIGDSSIQLRLTTKQLANVDKQLSDAQKKIDSVAKIKSKEITLTKIQYVPQDVTLNNTLMYNKDKNMYELNFYSFDSVRSFSGISKFKMIKKDNIYNIEPDSTEIKNFKLNFDLIISQYDDPKTKYTRTKIVPYFIDSSGNLVAPISENLLKINFRNAEILDKPWTNNPLPGEKEKKTRLASGWALTFSPFAFGMYPSGSNYKFGYSPNVGISYYITLRKK